MCWTIIVIIIETRRQNDIRKRTSIKSDAKKKLQPHRMIYTIIAHFKIKSMKSNVG